MMCCTNSRNGAGEEGRLPQPRPQQSPSVTSLSFHVPAHCCCCCTALLGCFPPSSRAPQAGPDTTSTAPPEAQRVLATSSTTRYTLGPEFLWHFLYPSQRNTHPCLLFAVGLVSAALYLPIVTRKPRKWIRNHLPPRHLVLGSVLVLVRKNEEWIWHIANLTDAFSGHLKRESLQDRHSLASYFHAVFEIKLMI